MKTKLQKLARQLLGFIPARLPVGVTEFEAWASSIEETYNLPTQDKDSIRFTLASIIMHLGPQASHKSKYYFYVTMTAAAAKQVAGQVFYDIKTRQAAAQKAAEAAANGPQL